MLSNEPSPSETASRLPTAALSAGLAVRAQAVPVVHAQLVTGALVTSVCYCQLKRTWGALSPLQARNDGTVVKVQLIHASRGMTLQSSACFSGSRVTDPWLVSPFAEPLPNPGNAAQGMAPSSTEPPLPRFGRMIILRSGSPSLSPSQDLATKTFILPCHIPFYLPLFLSSSSRLYTPSKAVTGEALTGSKMKGKCPEGGAFCAQSHH